MEGHRRHPFQFLAFFLVLILTLGAPIQIHATDSVVAANTVTAAMREKTTKTLIPMGCSVGVKLFSKGVMVVGLSKISSLNGECSPAAEGGLAEGDIITHVGIEEINSIENLVEVVQKSGGGKLNFSALRNDKVLRLQITPAKSKEDDNYKLGAWIRDSMAGIGTLTFYDPETKTFGALGHGVNDVDTSLLMPLSSGAIMDSKVTAVKRGTAGCPGELQGTFDMTRDLGSIYANTDYGIFGTAEAKDLNLKSKPMEIKRKSEVKTGPASILSNISGEEVVEYSIEIVKQYPSTLNSTRNMMIRVTDQRLLDTTGGIVQGMSGSPIIQDGKIVGAVTHVLVNDPARGYGIYIENMLNGITGENIGIAAFMETNINAEICR